MLDYMPCYRSFEKEHYLPAELYRYIRLVRGRPRLAIDYAPAPNYARGEVSLRVTPEYVETCSSYDRKDRQYLYSSLPLDAIVERREITLEKDEFLLLSYNEKAIPIDIEREKIEYCRTLVYWLNWTNRTKKYNCYNDVIERSMLVLKLLSYYNGAMLAAVTTSLPETIGEERNWDYRFCWLRDASMSIETMFRVGHVGAARRFMKFIQSTLSASHDFQIMYGIRGERTLTETTLDHLAGYAGSRPVRIGNDAYRQRQNDSFGYLMDLIYQYYRLMPGTLDEIEDMWELVKSILDNVSRTGATPTRASGRSGAKGSTSSPRRSCAGWRSTAERAHRRDAAQTRLRRELARGGRGDPPRRAGTRLEGGDTELLAELRQPGPRLVAAAHGTPTDSSRPPTPATARPCWPSARPSSTKD